MEKIQQSKPWALLFILLGVIVFIMAWTSYTFILRMIIALISLVLIDYGMGMLGLPTLSQFVSTLIAKFTKKQ